MAASSSVVIKVKYGDTLRRFSAQIVDDGLNLSMDGLRNRILTLFSFDPDTDLTLTYIDEDNDVVTLADNDDLRDVVRQALNPVRITAQVKTEKNAQQYSGSSASSTPLSSTPLRSPRVVQQLPQNLNTNLPEILKTLPEPLYGTLLKLSSDLAAKASSSARVQQPLQNLNNGVSEILKTVPDPLLEAVKKLSTDLASKASSSAPPVITELVDQFSKVGLSYLDQLSQSNVANGGVPERSKAATETKDVDQSNVDPSATLKPQSDKRSEIPSRNKESLEKLKPDLTKENEVKIQSGVEESSENINVTQPANDPLPKMYPEWVLSSRGFGTKEKCKKIVSLKGKSRLASQLAPLPNNAGKLAGSSNSASNVPNVEVVKLSGPIEAKVGPKPGSVSVSDPTKGDSLIPVIRSPIPDGFVKYQGPVWVPTPGNLNIPGSLSGPTYECPFSGSAPPLPAYEGVPLTRSINQNDGGGAIFHRGVRCDGCGVHPITGPRFKSKVKVDYDLCSICFEEMGNNSDYIRMDRPVVYRHHMSFKGLHDARVRDQSPTIQQVQKSLRVKQVAAKLDSRFIQDVNIFDGTVMAPLTPFTKIWRMRNNGTVVWPQKTQLVWIGGDKLSNELAVEVQIPASGLMIDEEIEVAVDFISPKLPGRYISYWRMASPSGQKFGQRVWVLIQVDASLNEAPRENVRNLNLNLPPASSGLSGPEIINVDPEPMVEDGGPSVTDKSQIKVELVQPNTEQVLKFPINDSLLVGNGTSNSFNPSFSAPPISYPMIDLSDVGPAIPCVLPTRLYPIQPQKPSTSEEPVAEAQISAVVSSGKDEVEEKLLKELEEMGFKQVDLNKEILRMNEYDLEQAVDELCGVAEWDPILEELQEMGFHDTATNKMLLKKNNGSIKRVVMDLIAGEKFE